MQEKLVDKLFEECTDTVEEVKKQNKPKISLSEDKSKHKCSFCTLYIVLFSIIFTVNIRIGTYFVYLH